MHRHALADQTLRAGETDTALVLHELRRRADAAVAEMVDVIDSLFAHVYLEKETDRLDDVNAAVVESAELFGNLAGKAELLVDFVAPDVSKVVVAELEEKLLEHRLGVCRGRRISGADAAVDILERILLVVDAGLGVFTQGLDEGAVVDRHVHNLDHGNAGGVDLLEKRRSYGVVAARNNGLGAVVHKIILDHKAADVGLGVLRTGVELLERVEKAHDVDIKTVAERAQKRGRVEFAAAAALIHEAPHDVIGVEHDFDPVSAVGDDADRKERLAVGVDRALCGDAGTAVQLGDNDALRAVDDKSAVFRHHRNLSEEHVLFAHVLAVLEAERGVQRPGVRVAVAERFSKGILLGTELVAHEIKHVAAVKARNREDFAENSLKTLVLTLRGRNIHLQEIVITLRLDLDEIRRIVGILEFSEYFAFGFGHVTYLSCRTGHLARFPP